MDRFTVIIEKTEDGYSDAVPSLPGCGAIADTKKEVEELIYEGIKFHLEGLKETGEKIPEEVDTEVETMVFA